MSLSRIADFAGPLFMALLLCFGAFFAFAEGRSFVSAPVDAELRFAGLVAGRHAGGLSSYSTRYQLRDCQAAMTGAYGRLQPEDDRLRAASACRDIALDTIESFPLDGFAYGVAARASAMLGERERAVSYLERSGQAFPSESWMAHQRVLVVQEWSLDDAPDIAALFRRDIGVMGMTSAGRSWLARWYIAEPARRETIAAAIDGLEERHRRAFLGVVRNLGTAQ